MARLDALHWKVDTGQTWNDIAALTGQPVGALLKANDLADTSTNRAASPRVGRLVHAPLQGV